MTYAPESRRTMNNELGNHRVPGRTLLASTVLISFTTVNQIVEGSGAGGLLPHCRR